MSNNFFTKRSFDENYQAELALVKDVYNRLRNNGSKDGMLIKFEIIFISNSDEKLKRLQDFLYKKYSYVISDIFQSSNYWEMIGNTTQVPLSFDNLLYWAVDMYNKAFEFDCKFESYSTMISDQNMKLINKEIDKADEYFDLGLKDYENGNFSGAIINWNIAIDIDGSNPDYFYSRAIAKYDLNFRTEAMEDYDKSIKIAPDFIDAIVNRAALKDELRLYKEALGDYDNAIVLDSNNSVAYFNRGNTKYNLMDIEGACKDWKKAEELGNVYAKERIIKECGKK